MNNEELLALEEDNETQIEGLPNGRTVPGVGIMYPPGTFDAIKVLAYLESLMDPATLVQARTLAATRVSSKLSAMKDEARKAAVAQQFAVPQGQVLQMPNGSGR